MTLIKNNKAFYSADSIVTIWEVFVKEFILLAYFPIWWITIGVKYASFFFKTNLSKITRRSALLVWIENWFNPMFGQYDFQGRLISFFLRTFQIIFRFLFWSIALVFLLLLCAVWILTPFLALSMIIVKIFL